MNAPFTSLRIAIQLPFLALVGLQFTIIGGYCNPLPTPEEIKARIDQVPDCPLRTSLHSLLRHTTNHVAPANGDGDAANGVWKIFRDVQRVECFFAGLEYQKTPEVVAETRTTIRQAYALALDQTSWVETKTTQVDDLRRIRALILEWDSELLATASKPSAPTAADFAKAPHP